MSDINKIMEAYLGMVSGEQLAESSCGYDKKSKKEDKKLDPVDDAENDKKFKDRKDKDIDNDGDVDSSDEYLHKRRKAIDDTIDGGKKPAKEEVEKDEEESEEEPKDKKKKPFPPKKKGEEEPEAEPEADGDSEIKKNPKTADKKAEISKIESVDTRSAFEQMWSEIVEAKNDPKKIAADGEKYDDHSSEHDKAVIKMHKKSDKKIEDQEEEGHDVTFKAGGKDMKQAPARSGADNLKNGDKTPIK